MIILQQIIEYKVLLNLSLVTNNESYVINHHTNLSALMKLTLMGITKPIWFTSIGVINLNKFTFRTQAEAATGGDLWKKVFLKMLQISQENACVEKRLQLR